MARWLVVALWAALVVFGVAVFVHSESPWRWRGSRALPANYRLSASDGRDVAGGPDGDAYRGRYLRRNVPSEGYFSVADLAVGPEIMIGDGEAPVLIPLSGQQLVAAFLNAGQTVAAWNGAKCVFRGVVAALLCPAVDSQPQNCQAVFVLSAADAASIAKAGPASLTLIPVKLERKEMK
jgi:hypothetical protein